MLRTSHVGSFPLPHNPKNIDFLDLETLEAHDKIIAPGIASSRKPRVEEIHELKTSSKGSGRKQGGE